MSEVQDENLNRVTENTSLLTEEKPTEPPVGKINFKLILSYCRACNWAMAILTLLVYALMIGASMAANFWLADWTDAEVSAGAGNVNTTAVDGQSFCDNEYGPKL